MHPLEAKLRAVKRRLRWWLVLESLARLTVWLLAGAMLFGAADYWFRFREPGWRWLLSLGFFTLAVWALYQWAASPAWRRISEVALALRLERYFPALADRLASSVSFLGQSAEDPTAGSPLLRELLIAQATQQAAEIDFRSALDPRPIRRSLLAAGAMLALVAVVVAADPGAVRIALARLVMPFGQTSWPQRTHLILLPRVQRLAQGEPFQLLVDEAKGKLPSDLRIHYRLETPEGIQEQSEPVRLVSIRTETGQWKQLGQVRREGLQRPFWYRLTGGDDTSMDWIRVEILRPPQLVQCQVRVIPPEYTGFAAETAGQWIRALVGSRVEITGRADRPVRAALLLTEEDQQFQGQMGEDGYLFIIGRLDSEPTAKKDSNPPKSSAASSEKPKPEEPKAIASGAVGQKPSRSHQSQNSSGQGNLSTGGGAAVIVRQSGRWRLRLIDAEGLEHEAASWEVRAMPDLPPSLTVLWPPAHSYATPSARIPVRVSVKDDLGIREVLLLAAAGEPSQNIRPELPPSSASSAAKELEEKPDREFRSWAVYQGPTPPPKQPKPFSAGEELSVRLPALEYLWDLASLDASAGMEVIFYLRAADYAGQTTSSQPHRIVLLGPEQFLNRLISQQNLLLAELTQWLQKQRSVHEQLQELHKALAGGEPIGQRQLDRLRSLELAHRQLDDQLAQSAESVLARLQRWLQELEQNHFRHSDLHRRLEYLRSGLMRLASEHAGPIGQALIRAIKAAQTALDGQTPQQSVRPPPAVLEAIAQALQHQQAIIQTVSSWLERFQPTLQTQRFCQEAADLIREQKAVWDQVRRIAQTTLTKEVHELGPQERADLQAAAQRQTDIARRTEQLQQEMAAELRQFQGIDPVSGPLVAEAVRYMEQTAPAAKMRLATEDILQNRMGRLLHTLPEILRHLEHLADLLANRQDQTTSRLTPLLLQTEQALSDYIKRQQQIQSVLELAARAKPEDRLALLQQAAADQQQLLKEVDRLAEQMEQLWAAQPSQAIRSALEAMEQTVQSARQGEAAQAIQASQAALQSLHQARQLLAQDRLQIQAGLLSRQLTQLREALPDLSKQQEAVWKETTRLEQIRKNTGTFEPQQQALLADLARQQRQLHAEITAWAEKLGELTVLQMALAETAHWMQQAAQALDQNQTGPAAQQPQQEALNQLRLLQEALAEQTAMIPLPKQTPPQGQQPSGSPEARRLVSAAELRLVRLWQQSIHERTVRFHQSFGDQPADRPELQAQWQELRQAQARLAQMVEQILRSDSSQERKP